MGGKESLRRLAASTDDGSPRLRSNEMRLRWACELAVLVMVVLESWETTLVVVEEPPEGAVEVEADVLFDEPPDFPWLRLSSSKSSSSDNRESDGLALLFLFI